MEIAAGNDVAIRQDERIVRRGIRLDFQGSRDLAELVQAGANDLGGTSQAIRILNALIAGQMTFANF